MIDLHMHTKYSDGTDNCIELLKKVQEKGLEVISITDHNTAKAYEELENIDIKEFYNGKIIPGIELNTKILGVSIEILGYGMDTKKMNEEVTKIYIPAEERNKIEVKRLYEKCLNVGIKLDEDCLERYNPNDFASKFIHKEITKYEENKKVIENDTWDDTKLFYRKYMSNPQGPLYVEMDDIVPDFETAANLIRRCGGFVFVPHIYEYRDNADKILKFILDNHKIEGIECYYTTFTEEQTKNLLEVCKNYNLYISGGSDYHGKSKPNVELGTGFGNLNVKKDIIKEWINTVKLFER